MALEVMGISGLATGSARMGMALLRGSAIGFERQWHRKMAGRNDAVLEQNMGRLSLKPYASAARWQIRQQVVVE
ncbi:MAG: hypothetical protein ACLQUZ_19660 [Rhizomicrobium sp.]